MKKNILIGVLVAIIIFCLSAYLLRTFDVGWQSCRTFEKLNAWDPILGIPRGNKELIDSISGRNCSLLGKPTTDGLLFILTVSIGIGFTTGWLYHKLRKPKAN